jgi:hypothetical protein
MVMNLGLAVHTQGEVMARDRSKAPVESAERGHGRRDGRGACVCRVASRHITPLQSCIRESRWWY